MGNLPIHIYGYNNEHDVIVYTVVKDTQYKCGQPRHRFQKSPFWSVYTRGHQVRSWRAGVLQSLAPTLIKHT